MQTLGARAFASLLMVVVVMAALLFGVAGTFDYWQAWSFLAVYAVASAVVTLWLLRSDSALLDRRMRGGPTAETSPTQRLIMAIVSLGFVGILVVPALDHRFGWSHVPALAVLAADGGVALGFLAIARVFRENTFSSATIEIAAGQTVVSTGPYAVVRHPMYAGALPLLIGMPVALGSWWGLAVFGALLPCLIWRLRDEEAFLARHLPGYVAYQHSVRWRLIPGVW